MTAISERYKSQSRKGRSKLIWGGIATSLLIAVGIGTAFALRSPDQSTVISESDRELVMPVDQDKYQQFREAVFHKLVPLGYVELRSDIKPRKERYLWVLSTDAKHKNGETHSVSAIATVEDWEDGRHWQFRRLSANEKSILK